MRANITLGHLYHERATEDPRIYNAHGSKSESIRASHTLAHTFRAHTDMQDTALSYESQMLLDESQPR